MRLLPEILERRAEGSRLEIDLRVPAELHCLPGHFPGLPIVPAVVQIDWSVRLARTGLELQGEFSRGENLKFLAIVSPRAELTLALELAAPSRLQFKYFRGEKRFSSGTLVFASAP